MSSSLLFSLPLSVSISPVDRIMIKKIIPATHVKAPSRVGVGSGDVAVDVRRGERREEVEVVVGVRRSDR